MAEVVNAPSVEIGAGVGEVHKILVVAVPVVNKPPFETVRVDVKAIGAPGQSVADVGLIEKVAF
jgi:hypothetical protein